MRKRINRPEDAAELRRVFDASRESPEGDDVSARDEPARVIGPGIRNGVKTERDTQPVQVRMLKAQIKVLKQIAAQEDRTASDVIRELVDYYIEQCLRDWPEGDALSILQSTIRQAGYWAEFERNPST